MKRVAMIVMLLPTLAAAQPAMAPDDFIRRVAEDNIADVEAGRLAQSTNTVPPPVQQLGRQISGAAMEMNARIAKLAGQRGLPLANQISVADRQVLERLAKLQGNAFAREYLRYVLADLEQDRALFQVATGLDDPAVAQFARDSLPEVEADLQVARAVYESQVATAPGQ